MCGTSLNISRNLENTLIVRQSSEKSIKGSVTEDIEMDTSRHKDDRCIAAEEDASVFPHCDSVCR